MKGATTREVILEAAIELGTLRGLEALTMGRLASTVEMSKSGLFAHFGSKQELQLATIAEAWKVFEAHVLATPPSGDHIGDPLSALLERWLAFYEQRVFSGGCLFVISAVEYAGRPGAVRDALATAVNEQRAALDSAVRAAIEGGNLHGRNDAGQMAFELFSTLVSADAFFHVAGDPAVFRSARATLNGLLAEWAFAGRGLA